MTRTTVDLFRKNDSVSHRVIYYSQNKNITKNGSFHNLMKNHIDRHEHTRAVTKCQLSKICISSAKLKTILPIVTSEELCVSRNLLRWSQTLGTQSMILFRSLLRIPVLTSASTSFRRRYLPRNPFTGSMWLAQSTHRKLWWSWRFVVEHVAWFMVPMM